METKIEENIRKYADMVYRISVSYLKNKDDADDIFQNVFIKYYNNYKKVKQYEKEWLIRVTINECKTFLKKNSIRMHDNIDEMYDLGEEKENPMITEEINKLDPKYRMVIYLYYFEGYKEKEISKILHITENGVKTRIKRAKEKLENVLKEDA